jgi:IS1 family transposase
MVGLEALPTFKRVAAWFLGPMQDTEMLLQRLSQLNRGLETGHWWVYQRREEPNGVRLVLRINKVSVTMLEGMEWRPFNDVG